MKLKAGHGFMAVAIGLPVGLYVGGLPRWGNGLLMGELLGGVNFIWVSFVIRRGLTRAPEKIRRIWLWNNLLRYIFIAALLYLAIRWPAVEIWAMVIGYSLIQIPAAVLHALRQ